MANNTNMPPTISTTEQELSDLRKRLDWFEEERRKVSRKQTELEQRLVSQEGAIAERDQRIQELEKQVTTLNTRAAREPQSELQLAQFRDDMVKMIEQYDRRRIDAERELDRVRRIEHESTTRELADLRKELPPFSRFQQDLQLRQAEDARLATLIATVQNTLTSFRSQMEQAERTIGFLEEKEKQNNKSIAAVQTSIPDLSKKVDALGGRIELATQGTLKVQASQQTLEAAQQALRDSIKDWTEQVQIGEHERNQRLAAWQRTMDEHDASLERFTKEWVKFNNQYSEARTAMDALKVLQEHLEQRQKEANELVRIETKRMEQRWEDFTQEEAKKWKNFESDFNQRQAINERRERQIEDAFHDLNAAIEKLQQDRDLSLRIQTAQAEAIKKWPVLWLEEIEKAMEQNPNRRRQPAATIVREE
jgi:chromosome segregation ATPase